ncbi:helix-turn-helix domain-containing protein [Agrobacterium rhizogenes]|nr:helix-turn-helix domain-containing protein [Rhizobium rhizogenes]
MSREPANDNKPLRLMTVKETAEMLAVSVSTLRELVRVGEIAYIQKGRGSERQHMSFHPQDIEDYIKRSRVRQCPSIGQATVRTTTSISASPESDFMGQLASRLAEARKRSKK